jgi:membrane protein
LKRSAAPTTYGSLGGVIVLMLWFYISGLAILMGAEMNAEIEHASPHGKAPGEKVPGEKKKLGTKAARAWQKKQKGSAQPHPSAPTRRRPPAAGAASSSKWRSVPVFILMWFARRRTRV